MTATAAQSPQAQKQVEERVARIEGILEHLATKADIAELKGSFRILVMGLTFLKAMSRS